MIKYTKNTLKFAVICGTFFMAQFNTCQAKIKNSEQYLQGKIDYNSFDVKIYEKDEINVSTCQSGNKTGLYIVSNDSNYHLKIYFPKNCKQNQVLSKNKNQIPKENIMSAELMDLVKFQSEENFNLSDLYEFEKARSYVLVNKECDYRVELVTDLKGNLDSLMIVNFKSEEGIYSFLNMIKLVNEKISEKA